MRLGSRSFWLLASVVPTIWACAQVARPNGPRAEWVRGSGWRGGGAPALQEPVRQVAIDPTADQAGERSEAFLSDLKARPPVAAQPLHAAAGAGQARPAAREPQAARHNELRLARLEPGKDKLANAIALFGPNYGRVFRDSPGLLAWADWRSGRVLRVEVAAGEMIETITVSSIDSLLEEKRAVPAATLSPRLLVTGRGLALGDARQRVLQLYGPPNSRGPSTHGSHALEFLFYAFDWAGSDVPQVMEVYCDARSGRVVEITLAAPTL